MAAMKSEAGPCKEVSAWILKSSKTNSFGKCSVYSATASDRLRIKFDDELDKRYASRIPPSPQHPKPANSRPVMFGTGIPWKKKTVSVED